jgi:hypothetical protein
MRRAKLKNHPEMRGWTADELNRCLEVNFGYFWGEEFQGRRCKSCCDGLPHSSATTAKFIAPVVDVKIFKIISPKHFGVKIAFFKLKISGFMQITDHSIGFQ